MRLRNTWVRARLRFLGWYVRFIAKASVARTPFSEFPRSLHGRLSRRRDLRQASCMLAPPYECRTAGRPERGRSTLPEDLQMTWDLMREDMRAQVTDFIFHVWLEPLKPAGKAGDKLFVSAPEHVRGWVRERYGDLLRRAAARVNAGRLEIELVDEAWEAPAQVASPPERTASPAANIGLNPKYTFEQFVICDGNRFAHAAALAVAELPGQAYNPLFLHGPPGLGKTHLLHAIGNYVTRYGMGLTVRYATVEEFTGEFVEAIRGRRTSAFRESFRGADVVLIDDVQFLANKEQTREEFFHMFNSLLGSGRQLVMTSDRAPEELRELEQRLEERFRSGLVVELEPPAFDVRL